MTSAHGKHEAADEITAPENVAADEAAVTDNGAEQTVATDDHATREVPALSARGLSLKAGRGWVFRDVGLQVRTGEAVLLVGPSGSGRSCLLLALTGRMSGATGDLVIAGHRLSAEPRKVHSRTAVARIGEVVVPEPNLTVAESIVERALLDGVKSGAGRSRFDAAADVLGLAVDPDSLVEQLSAIEQTALALSLAFIAPADVVVLDDVDAGVDAEGLQQLCGRMVELTRDGTAVIATAVQPPGDPTGLTVVILDPATGSVH